MCLQLEADLTLNKAKKLICQRGVVGDVLHKPLAKDVISLDAVRQSTTVRRKLPAILQKSSLNNCYKFGSSTPYALQRRQPVIGVIDVVITAHSISPT